MNRDRRIARIRALINEDKLDLDDPEIRRRILGYLDIEDTPPPKDEDAWDSVLALRETFAGYQPTGGKLSVEPGTTHSDMKLEMFHGPAIGGKMPMPPDGEWPGEALTFDHVEFTQYQPWQDGFGKWGLRQEQVTHKRLLNCWGHHGHIYWIGDDGELHGKPTEHFDYDNLTGHLFVERCLIEEWGGQAIQVVNRQERQHGNPIENEPTQGARLDVVSSVILNTGQSPSRGSRAISVFQLGRPGHPAEIRVIGTLIRQDWEHGYNYNGKLYHGQGWLLAQNVGYNGKSRAWDKPASIGDNFTPFWANSLVEVRSNKVYERSPLKQSEIHSAERVVLTENELVQDGERRYFEIDPRHYETWRWLPYSGEVIIEGNTGNVEIRYRGGDPTGGEMVFLCSENMRFKDGKKYVPAHAKLGVIDREVPE